MSRPFSGWRPSLRMARRDALRARGRSVLVLVMIALPVLAVTAADIAIATQDIQGGEALERRMGAADAYVTSVGADSVPQSFDPDQGYGWSGRVRKAEDRLADLRPGARRDRCPGGRDAARERRVQHRQGARGRRRSPRWTCTTRSRRVSSSSTSGRLPEHGRRGRGQRRPGSRAARASATTSSSSTAPSRASSAWPSRPPTAGTRSRPGRSAPSGWTGPTGRTARGRAGWSTPGDRSPWDDVRALNAAGMIVASRAVISDPPPAAELPADMQMSTLGRLRDGGGRRADRGDGPARGGAAGRPGLRGHRAPAGADASR